MNKSSNFSPSREGTHTNGRIFSGNVNIAISNLEAVLNNADDFANGGKAISAEIQTVPSKWFFIYKIHTASNISSF